jgi:L-ornithine N5-monooxygenase
LKDLVTLRDPTSSFTFLNYLHSQNRLQAFINLSTFTPFRREFSNYFRWCADRVIKESDGGVRVEYGSQVQHVTAVIEGDVCEKLRVYYRREGQIKFRDSSNLIFGIGGKGKRPRGFEGLLTNQSRVIHSSEYLEKIDSILEDLVKNREQSSPPLRVGILGSGQSSVEILLNLRERLSIKFPNSELHLIFRQAAIHPSDDSPFVNQVFDSRTTDLFYMLSSGSNEQGFGKMGPSGNTAPEDRTNGQAKVKGLLKEMRRTNYGVANPETLNSVSIATLSPIDSLIIFYF